MAQFSVIIPCYKQAEYLSEALASVLGQTYPDWECIIVDDGSPDDTGRVAAEWVKRDGRFHYVEKSNGGLPSARNAGLSRAAGQFVHFLDADDYIVPEMYSRAREVFASRPEASAVYSGCRLIGVAGKLHCEIPARSESADWFHELLGGNLWPCHAVLSRKDVVEAAGAFDTTLKSCEDWDLWLRMASLGGMFVPMEGTFACYRQHPDSMSRNRDRMLRTALSVLRRHAKQHGKCRQCKLAEVKGTHRIFELYALPELKKHLDQAQLVRFTKRWMELCTCDATYFKDGFRTLCHAKRIALHAIRRSVKKLCPPS